MKYFLALRGRVPNALAVEHVGLLWGGRGRNIILVPAAAAATAAAADEKCPWPGAADRGGQDELRARLEQHARRPWRARRGGHYAQGFGTREGHHVPDDMITKLGHITSRVIIVLDGLDRS